MPDFVLEALQKNSLLEAYESRPPYQQNDYIGWINRALQGATKQKRLDQMLEELKAGDTYMGMGYGRGGQKPAVKQSAAPGSVDAYLASIPPEMRKAFEDLRRAIKAAAPAAEELIYYKIPSYRYHGSLVHFMAQKKHGSFIAVSRATLEKFKNELQAFEVSGTTVHFTPGHPLPAGLVKKIVQARMKENEAAQPD
jgi:uncharacterized protein YdhG (YjbR/CyaY superfamily)